MDQHLFMISLVVDDYDKAIQYYTQHLNMELIEDTKMSETKRWVVVKPKGHGSCQILLAKAKNEEEENAIGNQTGGRVFLFLHTDDFWRDYDKMKEKGVEFVEEPREELYGTVVVFKDIYGNKWDFIQPK